MTGFVCDYLSPRLFIIFSPVIFPLLKLFGKKQEQLQSALICWHNAYTRRKLLVHRKNKVEKVLVILPHCLQNSACVYRVTWDKLENCRSCGKCVIQDFKKLKDKKGISTMIVTGGRSAREAIKSARPDLIIASACEEDLFSGIRDVSGIPVLGVVNKRPNGPCRDTVVDFTEIKNYLDLVLD
jgi:uncharacterized protein